MNELELEKLKLERELIIEKIKKWYEGQKNHFLTDISSIAEHGEIIFKITSKPIPDIEPAILIIQFPADIEDNFDYGTVFRPLRQEVEELKFLSKAQKYEFANMIKIPILGLNLVYNILPSIDDMEYIEIKKTLYFDGFNKNLHFNTGTSVINGYEIVKSKFYEFKLSMKHEDL